MLIREKRNWKKETANLTALLPSTMIASAWTIGWDGYGFTLTQTLGKEYGLGRTYKTARANLEMWIEIEK